VLNPHVARGPTPRDALIGVSTLIDMALVLAVPTQLGIATLPNLLALLRRERGRHSGASSGIGNTHHSAGGILAQKAGLDITHVPCRGGGLALSAMLPGEITLAFPNLPTILPQAQAEAMPS
jgi:tripartite-type tricarboxylate transporter receptor subunit TctC